METQTRFKAYEPGQMLLLPPDLQSWLPEGHLVHFVRDLVASLDLRTIYAQYDGSQGGQPPYDPRMMVGLLLYAYCVGVPSSRRVEALTYESVAFRVLTVDQHPDHDTIAEFRRTHLPALAGLFAQVLGLCRAAGLAKLGQVSLDGTKVKANASKHKAMSYGRMEEKAQELEAEVQRLLAAAEATDAQEDARYGKGKRGDELPEVLRHKQSRLAKIREAQRVLEEEARAAAEVKRAEQAAQERERVAAGKPRRGPKPQPPCDTPAPKAQRNFTDPDSRIMKDGATKAFQQSYNAQAVVDVDSQVIVATGVTQEANDKCQLEPMVEQVKANLSAVPKKVSADAGYFSEDNVKYLAGQHIDGYLATGRDAHGKKPPSPRGRIPKAASLQERMTRKLRTKKGRATYAKRKGSVEPVFGQIKAVRGLRAFLLRGLEKVRAEWDLFCLTHNLLKLYRRGYCPATG